jgi:polyisoprenyl-teichoic acid--peptidoglycan teichoic acid transferase
VVAALLVVVLGVGIVAVARGAAFLGHFGNPLEQAARAIDPPVGSLPWKLRHGQQANVLLLGYGGAENDAPYLTDTVMVLSIDPANHRAMEVSIPRDLEVGVDAWPNHRQQKQKINVAYEIGMDDGTWQGKRPEFTRVRDRGGRLAMQTVGTVTGLRFDGYVGVDFKAFRDLVDALGGVQVCLAGPLDDLQYPDYHNGYVRGGIHFRAGCQQVNGEQALQLARSRHAVEAAEANDFARAKRQQLLLNAIRNKATSVGAVSKAPALMDALQKDVDTSFDLNDLRALADWQTHVPDGAVGRVGVSAEDFLGEFYLRQGTCGDFAVYTLCPQDPTFGVLHGYFAGMLVDPKTLQEGAPVQVVNASRSLDDLADRVTHSLQPLGLKVADPARTRPTERSTIYDYSGGRYPLTTKWLATYFNATVVTSPSGAAPATPNPPPGGIAVVLGHDYALRWIGQG